MAHEAIQLAKRLFSVIIRMVGGVNLGECTPLLEREVMSGIRVRNISLNASLIQ